MKIVGSIVTNTDTHPFIFDDETNQITLDEYSWQQNEPMNPFDETDLIVRIGSKVLFEVIEIRIGKYYCESCNTWNQAVSGEWSYRICLSCSLDRDSETFA